jgi:hypothetical protein
MAVIDSGTGSDSPETLTFSVLAGMRSLSAVSPLDGSPRTHDEGQSAV